MSTSISVFWKDEHEVGLKGVVEVHPFDLPQGRLHGARVSDLIRILNRKVRAPEENDGILRTVMFIYLYGIQLSLQSFLEPILPNLVGSSPRLVATMETRPTGLTYLTIHVDIVTGTNISVRCSLEETVSCFKLRIRDIEGISPEEQILIHRSTKLEDHCTLSSYGIEGGKTISLMVQLSGGFTPARSFADVSNPSILVPVDFDPTAPVWREAWKGLNIEGVCKTSTCAAYGKWIIHPKKFDPFNLFLDTAKCPMCQSTVKPVTCGFYDCVWKFDGMKAGDSYSIASDWIDAFGYKYHRFDTRLKGGLAEWESLLIVAKPRADANAAKLIVPSEASGFRSNDVCTMCWSKLGFGGKESFVTSTCKHTFHLKCFSKLSTWCLVQDSLQRCPTCRKPTRLSTVPLF